MWSDSDAAHRRAVRGQVKELMNMKKPQQQSFFQSRARPLGSGTYNDVFTLDLSTPGTGAGAQPSSSKVVMRLSYYDAKVLHMALRALDGRVRVHTDQAGEHPARRRVHVDSDSLKLAQRHSRIDPVKIKNNYSLVCKFLIESGVCPHYVYIYHYKDCKNFTHLIRHLLPEKRLTAPQQVYTNVSFHELFDCNLHAALSLGRLTAAQLRVVLFQVLYSLLCLQHYLPGFRHNDVSLSNILLKLQPASTRAEGQGAAAAAVYRILPPSDVYCVPGAGVTAALWDFDLAHAPGKILQLGRSTAEMHNDGEGINVCNHVIVQSRFAEYTKDMSVRNINASFNPSFDTYFFLRAVGRMLSRKDYEGRRQFDATREFISSLGLMECTETYTHHAWPGLDPLSLLRHDFFADFRAPPSAAPPAGLAASPVEYGLKPLTLRFLCTGDQDISDGSSGSSTGSNSNSNSSSNSSLRLQVVECRTQVPQHVGAGPVQRTLYDFSVQPHNT